MTRINPPSVPPPPPGRFAHAVRVDLGDGALLFVSGQIAVDEAGELVGGGDMAVQSEHVFGVLDRILRDQGGSFDDVINIRTSVTDMSLLRSYGAVRARYLTGALPTSTTVQVAALYKPGALVEVDVVAALPASEPAVR